MKSKLSQLMLLLIFSFIGISLGFILVLTRYGGKQEEDEKLVVASVDEQAQQAWLKGCIPHLVTEAQKLSDALDEKSASAKAQIYCQCEWDYMINSMGLSLDEVGSIGRGEERGVQAIKEAQNYCYELHKGDYYP